MYLQNPLVLSFTEWLKEPLNPTSSFCILKFCLKVFWLARIGKSLQFIGGLTILLDFIGESKLRSAQDWLISKLENKNIRSKIAILVELLFSLVLLLVLLRNTSWLGDNIFEQTESMSPNGTDYTRSNNVIFGLFHALFLIALITRFKTQDDETNFFLHLMALFLASDGFISVPLIH